MQSEEKCTFLFSFFKIFVPLLVSFIISTVWNSTLLLWLYHSNLGLKDYFNLNYVNSHFLERNIST